MKLSENNIKIMMLDLHQNIEDYADLTVKKIFAQEDDFIVYPPNGALLPQEKEVLKQLSDNVYLRSALRKVIADNSAAVIFYLFNLFDGTASPHNDDNNWTGIKLADEEELEFELNNDFLHDTFFFVLLGLARLKTNKGLEIR